MNLKEILNYRNVCPICSEPLLIKSEESSFQVKIFGDAIRIEIGRDAKPKRHVHFYNDNTFKGNTAYDKHPNYLTNVIIRKYCKKCFVKGKTLDTKPGVTLFGRITLRGYYYSLRLNIMNGKYQPELVREYFSYSQNSSLFIADNGFTDNILHFEKFKTLNDRWTLNVQSKDLSHYENKDDFLKAIEIYMIFS